MQIDLEQESQSIQADNIILPLEYTKLLIDDYETSELIIQDQKNQIYAKAINGSSTLYFKNGDIYEGDIHKGMMHGKGVFKWENCVRYEGTFVNNVISGQGEYFWPDGSYYKGDLMFGKRHGQGYYETAQKKTIYTGQWLYGQRSGKGKIQFQTGASFEGDFLNGVKHGKGIFRYASGNYYEGEFQNDKKEGQGTMHWLDTAEKYFGQWSNNLQNGFGVHIWLESKGEKKMLRNRYEGQWVNGERNGFGVFYYANGSKYEGEWKNNLKEGFAIFTEDNGNVIQGTFKADKLISNILDKPQLSLNFDDLDKTDSLNMSNSIINSPGVKANTKRNLKDRKDNSPGNPKKSILATRSSIQLLPKSQNQISSPQQTINNIPQEVPKQSGFRPHNSSTEKVKDLTINITNNKSILGTDNSPTKRSNDMKKEQQNPTQQKEIQENPYNTLLDYSDLDINFTNVQAVHHQINTILLRYNSNLISWFKECSTRFESTLGEFSFSLDMQQMWKFLKEIKIFGDSVTQPSINRLFHKGIKNRFSINTEESQMITEIQVVKQLGRFITEEERRDLKLVEFLQAYKRKLKYDKQAIGNVYELDPNQEVEEITYSKQLNIHDLSQPLLYRHFIDIIVRIAFLRTKIPDQIHIELEKIIEHHIKPWIENKKKVKNSAKPIEDELISYFAKATLIKVSCKPFLDQLFDKVKVVNRSSRFGFTDETCFLKDIIKILKQADLIKNEQDQNFVLFLLEQGYDPQLTLAQIEVQIKEREKEREKEQQKVTSKRVQTKVAIQRKKTPDFKKMREERVFKLLNNELIYSEFIKLVLVYCIKHAKENHPKLDDESLEKKVCNMIEKINKKAINLNDPRLNKPAAPKIWPQSIKDVLKVELSKEKLKKVEMEKEKKRREEERKREQRERAQMELNDFNAPSDVEEDSFDDY